METNKFEILECSRQTMPEQFVCAAVSIPFELELFGTPLELIAVCTDKNITLKDLAHPARQLCDIVCRLALEHQRLCGQPVRCASGCAACCKYAAAISLAEAFAINDRINNLFLPFRAPLLKTMTMAARKILGNPPPQAGASTEFKDPGESQSSNRLLNISQWYSGMDLTCPWIENKTCSMYADRPLVCREFMVTSAPACCSPTSLKTKTIVDLPIRTAEVLTEICSMLTGTRPQTMFLPLVGAWCEEFADLGHKSFDAAETMTLLIDTLHRHHERTLAPAAVNY
jgi:Fe-S-cluster containining protein